MAMQSLPQGWIPFEQRTLVQNAAHFEALSSLPKFEIVGRTTYPKDGKAFLTNLWKHERVKSKLGFEFPGVHQITGSCVGAGGGNMLFSLATADAIMRGEPEEVIIPFWLLPYGRSRYYLGDTSPGEGSTGSTFARACIEDGTLDGRGEGLPEFKNSDGLVWGERVEMSWSDGDAKQTMDLLPESRKHLVQTAAYPVTIASSWGGRMECPTKGDPPVLLNEHSGSWSHQMSVQNWWDHPTLGEIFWVQNQWGDAHGHDPAGGPAGGFWVVKNDIDWICRNGEVYAFSQFNGYPAQDIAWDWQGGILV
jgi:hypothetical protein